MHAVDNAGRNGTNPLVLVMNNPPVSASFIVDNLFSKME